MYNILINECVLKKIESWKYSQSILIFNNV